MIIPMMSVLGQWWKCSRLHPSSNDCNIPSLPLLLLLGQADHNGAVLEGIGNTGHPSGACRVNWDGGGGTVGRDEVEEEEDGSPHRDVEEDSSEVLEDRNGWRERRKHNPTHMSEWDC